VQAKINIGGMKMSDSSNDNNDYPDQPIAWAIMGANCTTSMAVAAGLTGAGAAVAIPVVLAGVLIGLGINALRRDF
jgi:hypothetical protein